MMEHSSFASCQNGSSGHLSGRIGYIDALRGFTMILVVSRHVSVFGLGLYGHEEGSYQEYVMQFFMPLFFFVSGFVFYRDGQRWTFSHILRLLQGKVWPLLISPFLFMWAFLHWQGIPLVEGLLNFEKKGYWFTFTLFEFLVVYLLLQWGLQKWKVRPAVSVALQLGVGLLFYVVSVPAVATLLPCPVLVDLLGIQYKWAFFLFFVLAALVRRYYPAVERQLDRTLPVTLAVCLYFGFNLWRETLQDMSRTSFDLLASLSGVVMFFALFRKHAAALGSDRPLGRWLQLIGRRTLDIYLIHYFFIFTNLQAVLPDFSMRQSPFLEFVVALSVAMVVIAASLGVSSLLRLSPTLAHYLFGQKQKSSR